MSSKGYAQKDAIGSAARSLAHAWQSGTLIDRLDEAERPHDTQSALAIQASVHKGQVGGWKCALPEGDRIIAAPVPVSAVIETPGPAIARAGRPLRWEPELAFIMARTPPAAASRDEVAASVGRVRLALELVHGRFRDPDNVGFYEMLADDLFNEYIILGPDISMSAISEVDNISVNIGAPIRARHPAGDPLAPLIWLSQYLAERGTPLLPGMAVITGAYLPATAIGDASSLSVRFGDLGVLNIDFA